MCGHGRWSCSNCLLCLCLDVGLGVVPQSLRSSCGLKLCKVQLESTRQKGSMNPPQRPVLPERVAMEPPAQRVQYSVSADVRRSLWWRTHPHLRRPTPAPPWISMWSTDIPTWPVYCSVALSYSFAVDLASLVVLHPFPFLAIASPDRAQIPSR